MAFVFGYLRRSGKRRENETAAFNRKMREMEQVRKARDKAHAAVMEAKRIREKLEVL